MGEMTGQRTPTGIDRPDRAARRLPGAARVGLERGPAAQFRRPVTEGEEQSPAGLLRREAIYRRLLAIADVIAAGLALIVSAGMLGDDSLRPEALLGLPVVLLMSKVIGLYDRDENLISKSTLDEAPALFQLATLYALTIWLLNPILVEGFVGRDQILGLWGALLLFGLAARAGARLVAARVTGPERCVAIGDPGEARRLKVKLANGAQAELVGLVALGSQSLDELDGGPELNGGPPTARFLRRYDLPSASAPEARGSLRSILAELEAHRVIIAAQNADGDEVLDLVRTVKSLGIRVSVVPQIFEVVGSSVEFDEIEGMPVLGVRTFRITRSSQLVKRAFDLFGSLFILAVCAVPIAVIAAAIKLGSRGPVFFRQTRVGRDGRRFQILKFRTMVDGADARKADLRTRNEADGLFKIAADPRITRVGGFLRRTSLDELAQIWNVLRGEMSLVGPRPLVVEEDQQIIGWRRRRLHLTPGITGRWQVLGSSRIPLRDMVKIDYLYVANWSLWTDVKILLRTVAFAAARRGL